VKEFGDLRPISVTSLLARVFERMIIHDFIVPKLPFDKLANQYAFKPTGSTTAALIDFNHHVTSMLEHSSYVHCLYIDFTKAFDTVNHQILLDKLAYLDLHPAIVALISSFLFNRTQSTRFGSTTSWPSPITRSIVQGSGLGPILYIIYMSDLKTLCDLNKLCLYADDTSLLIPQSTNVSIADELENIKLWAFINKLIINWLKTKQMVLRRPNLNASLLPPPLPDIELVHCIKLLGVYVSCVFNQEAHVNFITLAASQLLYLLKMLKLNGLNNKSLDCIFSAIVISRIIYAIETWGNYVTKEMIGKIDKMLKKARRWGLCSTLLNFEEIKQERCKLLFKNICKNKMHCLSHLLPPERPQLKSLRPREHNYQIPEVSKQLHRKSFLIDSLIKGGITAKTTKME